MSGKTVYILFALYALKVWKNTQNSVSVVGTGRMRTELIRGENYLSSCINTTYLKFLSQGVKLLSQKISHV